MNHLCLANRERLANHLPGPLSSAIYFLVSILLGTMSSEPGLINRKCDVFQASEFFSPCLPLSYLDYQKSLE